MLNCFPAPFNRINYALPEFKKKYRFLYICPKHKHNFHFVNI